MSDNDKLEAIRERIDSLDQQIQQLINARAAAAQEVADIKLAADPDAQFYRPEREAEVLRRVKARNTGPLDGEEVARLFREIMSACLALEQPLKIAFLGPEGTFTQAAALKHFGHSVKTTSLGSIPDVFREVESGICQYGVVPVENSTEGVISHTLDTFLSSPLMICGEVSLRINHNLLSHEAGLDAIKTVYSHQQSLAQCRSWLDHHLPRAERVAVGSNAEAAKMASDASGCAAVAGETAAEVYALPVLASNIEDEPGNTTRFLVIGNKDAAASGEDKTSLLFSIRNVAGGLHTILSPFAEHGISMTRIESRPSRRGRWDYVFFVDINGHRNDQSIAEALAELEKKASLFKVLGSYPRAVL
ncbi:MAG: prephenate dehydratase [Gammaproteobacteria bacterium (ex Lamellibrachia satsuma)]|uniref:Bifunctional chorismate mutase/prephenate dehydratase n=1 Tax=endosymbiont of Lamellibrachia luymesi TaxID=2200907 RepID=A0A370E387_9GAMM|nr:MAG: prephenate dehydratase [Gammaproteobacteria bacterium (ex Lamellibrachia satsuma)]RDH89994.1 MAG: prephenate dehydratase [endosymbiont of Seepiophila jonesi]RDH93336.1 MAG: prephenate dehydratase [endosymbiont of Lamellibrachia luymesi]RRS33722.1 MAG: prephenate dehydratase [Gammaproteobacteria bacterium (ex Lamellibrachia satsuma)]RRS34640.1 MAG: prephenate dehydratase [Gammaproteobacteria bacterium (ex Lamellibrachia satsuma)]